jgi:phosphopantothenoylcysteine decarboxylase/phosphopantothenate--cysteine ligase
MSVRSILITAGPTHEHIDAVRYLANRSSGRMGVALADAARAAGCRVTLLLGPATIEPQAAGDELSVIRFESTADLQRLLEAQFPACDVLIMAAAVADYRPVVTTSGKLPRRGEKLVLELEPTPDLVAACAAGRRPGQCIVAFALEEPSRLAERALEKLRKKGVDAIVANPLETMGSTEVRAVVHTADGRTIAPQAPTTDKQAFADWLVRWILAEMH